MTTEIDDLVDDAAPSPERSQSPALEIARAVAWTRVWVMAECLGSLSRIEQWRAARWLMDRSDAPGSPRWCAEVLGRDRTTVCDGVRERGVKLRARLERHRRYLEAKRNRTGELPFTGVAA